MIGWVAVVLKNDLVIDVLILEDNLAVDDVFELSLSVRDFHPDDKRLVICFFLFDLLFGQTQAESVIFGLGVLLSADFDSHFLKALGCAETGIGIAVFK